jgi:hypothetical protein
LNVIEPMILRQFAPSLATLLAISPDTFGQDKRIPVEQQIPKRIQIEDDAERSRSFVAHMTSNSIDELGELASELTSALQNLQGYQGHSPSDDGLQRPFLTFKLN